MRRSALYLCLLACVALTVTACNRGAPGDAIGDKKNGQADAESIVPVEIAIAARETLVASFQGTASLEAEERAQVVSKTSGVILDISVEEGQKVRKGAVMAKLDQDRQRLQLRQSAATLAKLENDFKRQKELFERKLIGQDIFERVRYDLDVQRAAHANSELELSYTEIRAPISGMVSKRLVKTGNLVQLNQSLFEIDDFDPLIAVLNIPERELQRIKLGQPVQMLVDARPGDVYTGVVQRIRPVVDASTGTFAVTTEFVDERLRPGMFGRLNVVYDTRVDALVIPRGALLGEGDEAAVFVVENDIVKRVPLQLGFVGDGKAEVLEGLTDGAQVVTLGQAAVRDGIKVKIIAR